MPRQKIRFRVDELRKEVNRRNRESICSPDIREGWNAILEYVLHATENYYGYRYIDSDDMEIANEWPGKYYNPITEKTIILDESRRHYIG